MYDGFTKRNGILIETSVAIRIKLKHLNKQRIFIIEDLDDHHLFVDENEIDFVRANIEKFKMEGKAFEEKGLQRDR